VCSRASGLVEIDDLQQWFILAHGRLSSHEFLMSAVASGIPDVLHYEETSELENERFKNSRNLLIVGNPEVGLRGCIGFDDELDALQLKAFRTRFSGWLLVCQQIRRRRCVLS
jgi:hypothetical protein